MRLLALALVAGFVALTLHADAAVRKRPTYQLTVVHGSGSGRYSAGVRVIVTANAAPAGYVFAQWSADPDDAMPEPVHHPIALVITIDEPTTITARYYPLPPRTP